MRDLYAGSWNYKQKMPHNEPLSEYLKSSFDCVLDKKPQDWVLVAIGTHQEVSRELVVFEKFITQQEANANS